MRSKTMSQQVTTITREVSFIPIEDVEPNPWNPNMMEEEKRLELKKLMAKSDPRQFFLKDPLWVSPSDVFYGKKLKKGAAHAKYVFIDGYHRWLNAKELGWTEVGIDIESVTESDARQQCYSKNFLRGQTDPIKEAKLFKVEIAEGRTQEQVAEKYFKDPGYISSSLSLLKLPKKVQDLLYKEKEGLTKSHLFALDGLPEEKAAEWAETAADRNWTASDLKGRVQQLKTQMEHDKAAEIAVSHFVLKNCPICGKAATISQDLKSMYCSDQYDHVNKFSIRDPHSLQWTPLDTKESLLAKKIKQDSGETHTLQEILSLKAKKGNGIKRKQNWFKYEKATDEIEPKINNYAYELLVANRPNVVINHFSVSGAMADKPDTSYGFSITSERGGLSVRLGDKYASVDFEKKEWKTGAFKTRVNVSGIGEDEPDAEAKLKAVQAWLDKLMRGEATVTDFPIELLTRSNSVSTYPSAGNRNSPEEDESDGEEEDPDMEDDE
jgi:ParB/RepB/Spo0J family partition protein